VLQQQIDANGITFRALQMKNQIAEILSQAFADERPFGGSQGSQVEMRDHLSRKVPAEKVAGMFRFTQHRLDKSVMGIGDGIFNAFLSIHNQQDTLNGSHIQ
jgi:hypothetical protein